MLVILEGCDGVGKTTLANSIRNALAPHAKIIHCTKETPNDYRFFSNIIYNSKNVFVVADRFMYGQFVYQTEEERHLTQEQLYRLETELLGVEHTLIHVRTTPQEALNRLSLRKENTEKPVAEIMKGFEVILGNSILEVNEWWT